MSEFLHRTWATVDTDALCRNYQAVRSRLSADCRCMAVVKANAYGHGAVPVAQALARRGADWFGVSSLDEALELRAGGITTPILILSYTPPEYAVVLARHNITQAVTDADHAERLEAAAAAANVTVRVHIKLDTGMSRVGFFCQHGESPVDAIAHACSLPHLHAEGIFTHFPVADEETGEQTTRAAFDRFLHILSRLEARGYTFALRHCCNSAAMLRFPDMHLDMVRTGIVLYGASEFASLQPTMTVHSTVSLLKTVPSGTPVGYGSTYTTHRETVLATVPVGYGDGFVRAAADTFHMTVHGQSVPIVGRVCMDQCMLDVTDIPNVAVGDEVIVFGVGGASVETYAACCGTIPYESLCLITPRVPRIYTEPVEKE